MATVKYILKLDDQLSKGLKSTAANVHAVVAALRELDAQAAGAEGAMAGTSRATQVTAEQAKDAAQALEKMAKTAGLTAEQSEKLATASKKASAAAQQQREAAKKQRAEARRAAATAKLEARERARLTKALDEQRKADERVRHGKEKAEALQEIRAIDQLIEKMKERNEITETELKLLERRKQQVRDNLRMEQASAAELGTPIDRGFGARGTRRSPIGNGVLSSHVKNLRKDFAGLNSALMNTGRQMPDVISQLATGARMQDVVIQQGMQVAQSVEAESSAISRFAVAHASKLGVVALAIAAAGTAWSVYKNAAEEGEEASGRVNQRIQDAQRAHERASEAVRQHSGAQRRLNDALIEGELRLEVMLGLVDEEEAAHRRRTRTIRKETRESLRAAEDKVRQTEREIEANRDAYKQAVHDHNARSRLADEASKLRKRRRDELADVTRLKSDINAREEQSENEMLIRQEQRRQEAADREVEEAKRAAERRMQEREREQRAREAAIARLDKMTRQADTAHLKGVEAATAAMEDQLAAANELAKALGPDDKEGQAAVQRARDAIEAKGKADIAAIQAAERDAANEEAAKAAIAAQEAAQGLKEALDLLSGEIRKDGLKSLLGGDVSGAIEAGLGKALKLSGSGLQAAGQAAGSMGLEAMGTAAALAAGPVGAAVVGLKEVGELGADGVQDLAEQTVDAIVAGIEALPEILVEVAPKLGIAIATEIVPALLKLPYLFAIALGEAIRDLFTGGRERRQDRRERRQNRRAEARTRRSFRSGTSIVQRDGPAMLHQGELVVPVTGTVSQDAAHRVRRQAEAEGGGGGVRIRPVTMDAIVLGISSPQATGPWSHWAGYGPKIGGHR